MTLQEKVLPQPCRSDMDLICVLEAERVVTKPMCSHLRVDEETSSSCCPTVQHQEEVDDSQNAASPCRAKPKIPTPIVSCNFAVAIWT